MYKRKAEVLNDPFDLFVWLALCLEIKASFSLILQKSQVHLHNKKHDISQDLHSPFVFIMHLHVTHYENNVQIIPENPFLRSPNSIFSHYV